MTTDKKDVDRFEPHQHREMRWDVDGDYVLFTDHERVVAELRAEIEALVKDAGRYRWLRDSHESRRWEVTNTYAAGRGNPFSYRNSTLDTAIDAAMKGQAE